MSDFVEILGEKKFSNNSSKDLRVRMILEQPAKLLSETNMVFDVNQEAQYYKEKQESDTFRIYGSVLPTLNMKLKSGEKPNYNNFRFSNSNWQVVLLKPTKYDQEIGKKVLRSEGYYEYDFNYGLPCLKVVPKQEDFKSYMAFNFHYGHNFQVDDRVYITSLDPVYIPSGYYNVISVDKNIVYINHEYVEVIPDYSDDELNMDLTISEQVAVADATTETTGIPKFILAPPVFTKENEFVEYIEERKRRGLFRRKKTIIKEVRSKYVTVDIGAAAPQVTELADNNEILTLNKTQLGMLNPSIKDEIKKKRPNLSKVIKPQFFIKKVKEDYHLEYYMKQLEVISVVSDLDDCGFALSSTGEQVKNFTFEDIHLNGLKDNLDIPITELYIGVIKRAGNSEVDLSDVESNFAKVIDYTDQDFGFEKVSVKQAGPETDKLKVGDKLFLGVFEYDQEELSEVEINQLHHRVLHRDISFSYKPFYPIQLKSFSSYVEDSEYSTNVPTYAKYSDLKQKYIWRDILDIGFFEEENVGIEHPFLNGAFYIFSPIVFTLNNDYTSKYRYNQNDITKLENVTLEIDGVRDLLKELIQDPEASKEDNKGYQEYKGRKC